MGLGRESMPGGNLGLQQRKRPALFLYRLADHEIHTRAIRKVEAGGKVRHHAAPGHIKHGFDAFDGVLCAGGKRLVVLLSHAPSVSGRALDTKNGIDTELVKLF